MQGTPEPIKHGYHHQMGNLFQLALGEVLGRSGLEAVLDRSHHNGHLFAPAPSRQPEPFHLETVASIHQSLEDLYGPHGGRGLALRTGRALFKYSMRDLGETLGITDVSFRLLPFRMKLQAGTRAIGSILASGQAPFLSMDETDDCFRWHLLRCPACHGRQTDSPACHLAVGVVQETLSWLSSGRNFLVEEVSCIAQGDPTCTIEVHRHPLD